MPKPIPEITINELPDWFKDRSESIRELSYSATGLTFRYLFGVRYIVLYYDGLSYIWEGYDSLGTTLSYIQGRAYRNDTLIFVYDQTEGCYLKVKIDVTMEEVHEQRTTSRQEYKR